MARIWNFQTHSWEDAEGKDIHTGNIETVPTKEKAKFPRHFFPEVNNDSFFFFCGKLHLLQLGFFYLTPNHKENLSLKKKNSLLEFLRTFQKKKSLRNLGDRS